MNLEKNKLIESEENLEWIRKTFFAHCQRRMWILVVFGHFVSKTSHGPLTIFY